jgi:predicted O-methyltransferase YrrM
MEPAVDLKRYTDNHTVKFLKFLVGLRPPESSVTNAERDLLSSLARGKRCIIEVGVFEGVTSQLLCRKMSGDGTLYLVDPFFPEVRLERLLNVSFTRFVATKGLEPWRERVRFVREPSATASQRLPLRGKAELIFIDARHDYDSVLEDFRCWAPMLAPGAAMAFHDSNLCVARPDLGEGAGPVRLMREIQQGVHGPWDIVAHADSITVARRRGESPA